MTLDVVCRDRFIWEAVATTLDVMVTLPGRLLRHRML